MTQGTGRCDTSGPDNTAAGVEVQPWTKAFAAKTPEAFAAAFTEDVTLEATALNRPITGRDNVKVVMAAASAIYESLQLTRQTQDNDRTHLEWQATGMGGQAMSGVTVLTTADDDRIAHVAIRHRPLADLPLFSSTIGDALEGTVDRSAFVQAVTQGGQYLARARPHTDRASSRACARAPRKDHLCPTCTCTSTTTWPR